MANIKLEEFKKSKSKFKHKQLVDFYCNVKSAINEQYALEGVIQGESQKS